MTEENHIDWPDGEPEEPTPEEEREALALALALERGTGGPDLPDEPFQVGSMLRYAQDGGELDSAKLDTILDDVIKTARVPEPAKANKWAWLIWALPGAGALMAAAVVLIFFVQSIEESASEMAQGTELTVPVEVPTAAAVLPPVPRDLLQAQAQSASGKQPEDLDAAMADYRSLLFASLDSRYSR